MPLVRADAFRVLSRRRAAYRAFRNSPEGRIVLADLVRFCRFYDTSYRPDEPESATFFREGRRDVLCRILNFGDVTDEDLERIIDQESE